MHLQQGLLHMEDMRGARRKKLGAMAQSVRSATRSASGRNEAASNPSLCRVWIHWQSSTSLLRPGTC